ELSEQLDGIGAAALDLADAPARLDLAARRPGRVLLRPGHLDPNQQTRARRHRERRHRAPVAVIAIDEQPRTVRRQCPRQHYFGISDLGVSRVLAGGLL